MAHHLKRTLPATLLPAFVLAVLALSVCHRSARGGEERAMYYWRTTLSLDSAERRFLSEHHVGRLYVRYFDVVMDAGGQPMPNATIAFADSLPAAVEVVPTVFITNDCMASAHPDLARKLVERVAQMNETHDVAGVRELQIDCDWTLRTRRQFFAFLDEVRTLARQRGWQLSATIRLHQLSQPVPPVDRGVLMVYNTGDVTRLDCQHPILDLADVRAYVPQVAGYKLPLTAAYPLFTWRVLFRPVGGDASGAATYRYVGIMHGDDDLPVMAGDTIVTRRPDMAHLMEARRVLARQRSDLHREVILYDLSTNNITLFNPDDYETIFGH